MFRVEFARKAARFLEKSERLPAQRILDQIKTLQQNPFPKDVKRVENQWFDNEKVFRIRVGDYRILYTVSFQKQRILAVNIDKRPRAY